MRRRTAHPREESGPRTATGASRGVGAVVSAVLLALTLTACGVPSDNKIRRIDPSEVPSHLVEPTPSSH